MGNALYTERTGVREMNTIPYYDRKFLEEKIALLSEEKALLKNQNARILEILKDKSPELFNEIMLRN